MIVALSVSRYSALPASLVNRKAGVETFAHVLPSDYGSRLRPVFGGKNLEVSALGVEDLLVMKCFAGREKDVGHARALLRRNPDLGIVERRLQELVEKRVKGAPEALDFFDDIVEAA